MTPGGVIRRSTRRTRSQTQGDENTTMGTPASPVPATSGTGAADSAGAGTSQPVLSPWSPSRGNVSGATGSATTIASAANSSKANSAAQTRQRKGKRKAPSSPVTSSDTNAIASKRRTRSSTGSPEKKRAKSSPRAGKKPATTSTTSTTTTASGSSKVSTGDQYLNSDFLPACAGNKDRGQTELRAASWRDVRSKAGKRDAPPLAPALSPAPASGSGQSAGLPTREIVCDTGAQATLMVQQGDGAVTATALNLHYRDGDVMVQDMCSNSKHVFFSLVLLQRDGKDPSHVYVSFEYEQVISGERIYVGLDREDCSKTSFQILGMDSLEPSGGGDAGEDKPDSAPPPLHQRRSRPTRLSSREELFQRSRNHAPRAVACTETQVAILTDAGDVRVFNIDDGTTTELAGQRYFKQLVAGDNHFVALSYQGDVYAWGVDTDGQLAGAMQEESFRYDEYRFHRAQSRVACPSLCMYTVGMAVVQIAAVGNATIVTTIDGDVYLYGQYFTDDCSSVPKMELFPRPPPPPKVNPFLAYLTNYCTDRKPVNVDKTLPDKNGKEVPGRRLASCEPSSPQSQVPNASWLAMGVPAVTFLSQDVLHCPGLRLDKSASHRSFFDVQVDTSTGTYDIACPLTGPARERVHFRFRGPFEGNIFPLGRNAIVVTQASPSFAQALAAAPAHSPCRQPWTCALPTSPEAISTQVSMIASPAFLTLAFDPRWDHVTSFDPQEMWGEIRTRWRVFLAECRTSHLTAILAMIRSMGNSLLTTTRMYSQPENSAFVGALPSSCTTHHAKYIVGTLGLFATFLGDLRDGEWDIPHMLLDEDALCLDMVTLLAYPVMEIWETYMYPLHVRHAQKRSLAASRAIFDAITSKAYEAFASLHPNSLQAIVSHLVDLTAILIMWGDRAPRDFCHVELIRRLVPRMCEVLQTLYQWFCLDDNRLSPCRFHLKNFLGLDLDYERVYDKFRAKDGYMNLAEYHFFFAAEEKQKIWRYHLERLMKQRLSFEMFAQMFTLGDTAPFCDIHVNRETAFEDALSQLDEAMDLRLPLRVFFEGEEGVDEGGVQKDFFQLVFRRLFNGDDGKIMDYFPLNSDGCPWFDLGIATSWSARKYYYIGVLFGLAVYNKAVFPGVIPLGIIAALRGTGMCDESSSSALPTGVGHWLSLMETVYPSVAASLRRLWAYEGADWLEHFGLSWSIDDAHGLTQALESVVELRDGMTHVHDVHTKEDYIMTYCYTRLVGDVIWHREALQQGFAAVVGTTHCRLMTANDLQLIMCGRPLVDIWSLKNFTRYRGGYNNYSQVILHFWQVIGRFNSDDVAKFLAFCTGCSRVPLGGWSTLQFTIQRSGDNQDRLPCAHTCFNTIDLPQYTSEARLEAKLRQAMDMCSEFALI